MVEWTPAAALGVPGDAAGTDSPWVLATKVGGTSIVSVVMGAARAPDASTGVSIDTGWMPSGDIRGGGFRHAGVD